LAADVTLVDHDRGPLTARRVRKNMDGTVDELPIEVRDPAAAVGLAVIGTDAAGRITAWNGAAERLYGWRRDEVIGRPILNVTPAAGARGEGADILSEVVAGGRWTGEYPVVRRDGTTFVARVELLPVFDADGTLVQVVGLSRELSPDRTTA
jgi:PAS domain S-box-containing protein